VGPTIDLTAAAVFTDLDGTLLAIAAEESIRTRKIITIK